jgi:Transposase zinc-binding domain/Putative transposase
MALVTLQMIFQDAFPAYEQTHPLPAHVRRAARAVMQCRTAALGGHVQACPDGHMARIWYNSCRHRACPQCAYLQTERWLARQQARLLACDHYHVIFTLPHDLNPLWLANVSMMTTLLFQAVHDTLRTLLADPKYLGAQPGIIAALHTWSQTLVLHPHVHCLVTGGGRTPDGIGIKLRIDSFRKHDGCVVLTHTLLQYLRCCPSFSCGLSRQTCGGSTEVCEKAA